MPELTLTVGTHFFRLNRITARAKPCVLAFQTRFLQYTLIKKQGRFVSEPTKAYRARTDDKLEYRFHIHQLPQFEEHLIQYALRGDMIERKTLPVPVAQKVNLEIQPQWAPRKNQPMAIDYCLKPNIVNRLLTLPPGEGKSYISCYINEKLGDLPIYIFRPMYLKKWIIDLMKTFVITPKEIVVVKGGDSLQALLHMASEGPLPYKVILLSNKTLQAWLTTYEEYRDGVLELGYSCLPEDMLGHLRVGSRWIDEVHLDYHLNFKIDCYTNVNYACSMSGTMRSRDPFINRAYEWAYPMIDRCPEVKAAQYIQATSLMYRLEHPAKVKVINQQGMYSQHLFEESILASKTLSQNILKMTISVINNVFFDEDFWRPGDRCVVYVVSINMAAWLTEKLRDAFPDRDVRRYVESDPYEDLMQGEILVTSLQKAGTNVDISMLTTVFLLHQIDSLQGNVQGIGRLRELADGRQPRFVTAVCMDIPKHMGYHENRMALLKPITASLHLENYGGFL